MAQLDSYFDTLIQAGGSDLHLLEGSAPKMRLHGHLDCLPGEMPLTRERLETLLAEICPASLWEDFAETGDVDFAYAYPGKARFRANYLRQFHGNGAIFRVIPSRIMTLDELGAPPALKTFASLQSGLVLVTGPTGSGKSTTLAGVIDHINSDFIRKIVTIEQPVEFMHVPKQSLIVHREVGPDTESFASGLKGALKSDANIVLVGEMRDRETIELALTAAETGMLVFGTLHTNSAAKTIDRIIDTFPAQRKNQVRSLLGNSLRGVVAQQLLPTANGKGRQAAYEILLYTSALPGIVRSGDTSKLMTMMQTGRQLGMQTMDDCLLEMVQSGRVTQEAAYFKALDKTRFRAK